MYNLKINKIDISSTFKFGIIFGTAISLVSLVFLFFYNIYRSIISALGPQIFIKAFLSGLVQLFFYLIVFAFCTLFLAIIFVFFTYVYNFSIKWFDGIKLQTAEIEELEETEEEAKETENDDTEETENNSN